jgi:hypothetical protein
MHCRHTNDRTLYEGMISLIRWKLKVLPDYIVTATVLTLQVVISIPLFNSVLLLCFYLILSLKAKAKYKASASTLFLKEVLT